MLDQVIENLNLNERYKTLGDRVTLDNPSNSRVLNITVTDPDPQMTKTIADKIAKVASADLTMAKTFTDREIADYGLTSLYFTRKDFIKWWMAP